MPYTTKFNQWVNAELATAGAVAVTLDLAIDPAGTTTVPASTNVGFTVLVHVYEPTTPAGGAISITGSATRGAAGAPSIDGVNVTSAGTLNAALATLTATVTIVGNVMRLTLSGVVGLNLKYLASYYLTVVTP